MMGDSQHTVTDSPWKPEVPLHYRLDNSEPTTDVFEKCLGVAKDFDKELVDRWEHDIDTLLVFAGLFSAVVTTFVVDTYKSLSPDPQDQMVGLLETLVAVSTQQGSIPDSPPAFTPDQTAIRVNIFFFLSLVTSLSSSLLAILCKQWLQEYIRDYPPHISDTQRLAIRQSRYQGLFKWRVPGLVAFIPLFLEVATVLFFVGLVDLLWSTHHTVAIVVMIPIVISLLFVAVTTVLSPILLLGSWLKGRRKDASDAGQCPYKTPLGWTIIRMLTTRWVHLIDRMLPKKSVISGDPSEDTVKDVITFTRMMNWTMYDINFGNKKFLAKGIAWLYPFISSGDFARCLDGLDVKTAYASLEELLPFLRMVRELSVGGHELRLTTLDRFFKPAKEMANLSDKTRKDIIVVSSILYRRNTPNMTKIRHCLERCTRIMQSLLPLEHDTRPAQDVGKGTIAEGSRDFSATVIDIIVFLVNACTYQLDPEFIRHIEVATGAVNGSEVNFVDRKDVQQNLRTALDLNLRRPVAPAVSNRGE